MGGGVRLSKEGGTAIKKEGYGYHKRGYAQRFPKFANLDCAKSQNISILSVFIDNIRGITLPDIYVEISRTFCNNNLHLSRFTYNTPFV